jgi:hypothetical protein
VRGRPDFLHSFRIWRQNGIELRHQECLDRVKLGRVDTVSARQIVNDAPCLAVILRCLRSCPRLAHESNVRTGRLIVLAMLWSFTFRCSARINNMSVRAYFCFR